MRGSRILLCIIICAGFFTACSPYKHLSEEGMLLSKVKIKSNTKEFSKSDLKNLVIQDPNSSVFGVKTSMYFYSLSPAGEDSTMSWFVRNTLRAWGQKPVEFDENLSFETKQNIAQYLKTKGSFGAIITDSIIKMRKWYAPWTRYKRRIVAEYSVNAQPRYKINDFILSVKDTVLLSQVKQIMAANEVKKGDLYDEDILSLQRDNLTSGLLQRGYFGFSSEYITYKIDTNIGNNRLNVTLNIANPTWQRGDTLKEGHHKIYTVRNIYVYPNYISPSMFDYVAPRDTSIIYHKQTKESNITRFVFIYNNNDLPIKIKPLLRSMLFEMNAVYSPLTIKRTYSALSQLRNFKYIDIKPLEATSIDWRADTLPVDFEVKLSLTEPVSISTGVGTTYSQVNAAYSATESSNFGLEYNLSLSHTNFLRGAEIFTLNTKFSTEIRSDIFQKSKDLTLWSYFSAFEAGVDAGIEIPRFFIPFATKFYSMQFRPHTTVHTGFNYQKRPDFARYIFNLNYGYTWINSQQKSHSFFPIELNFVKMDTMNANYQAIINTWSKRMRYQVSDHLVMDMRYTYLYNGQILNTKSNYHYFRFNVEASGNVLYVASKLSESLKDENNQYLVLGIPFSQYVRTDMDFVQFFLLTKRQTFVVRGYFGIGASYGNGKVLPYERNFFGGGANNLRAWELRSLGPGAAAADTVSKYHERSGDIAFGGNIEYRFPVFGFIEGAAFFDFGNVWLLRPQNDLKDGEFEFSDFYKEIAAGVGFGLRLNFKFIILRFDCAVKMLDPSKPKDERFVLTKDRFSGVTLQIGLNYPF
ncbi:MAG: BamA/TamA family outer membrane protein [Bacteroidales bacterium]|nr:BamA/TamA family outer membrane protein [Bacteroidales bacterium]